MSAIHTALPPDPVITATRLPRGGRQKAKAVAYIDHVVEILAADDAVMAEDRVVDDAGMRQRAGMRGRGTPPGVRSPDLGDDHRLAGLGGLVGNGAKAVGPANALEIKQENVGAALVEPPIDVIVRLKDRLVAGADLVGKAQLPIPPAAQE